MDLRPEDIIKAAVVSAKSKRLFDGFGKIVFRVLREANKLMIRKAVERIWNVRVKKIAVINVKGESRRFSGRRFVTKPFKKAVVTLREGYKIDTPWQQTESMTEGAAPAEVEKLPEGS